MTEAGAVVEPLEVPVEVLVELTVFVLESLFHVSLIERKQKYA